MKLRVITMEWYAPCTYQFESKLNVRRASGLTKVWSAFRVAVRAVGMIQAILLPKGQSNSRAGVQYIEQTN